MMPQLKSLKKVFPILLLVVALFVPTIDVDASSVATFYKNYGQPETSSTSGYLEIYWKSESKGLLGADTYYWSINPYHDSEASSLSNSYMTLNIGKSNGGYRIQFTPNVGSSQYGYYTLIAIFDSPQILESKAFTGADSYTVDYSTDYTILGFHVYGNFGGVTEHSYGQPFAVNYGSNNNYLQLTYIYQMLNTINNELGGKLDTVVSSLASMLSSTDDLESLLTSVKTYLSTELPNIKNLIGITNTKLDTLISQLTSANVTLSEVVRILSELYFLLDSANPSDVHKGEEFEDSSNAQADSLKENNNKLDSVEKPNASQLGSQTFGQIDFDSVGVFGATLAPFMSNSFIVKMMVTSVILCIIGYVFFGKKG